MAAPSQGVNTDQFDAYFQLADSNKDGKISGTEAVSFFQGSNLPKHVLAQIWQYADQSRTGFLGRLEFKNALKLVTVAQSKRELTPDIVKAALFGPASAKIPAPQINLTATPANQLNSGAVASATQFSAAAPTSLQNIAIRGQVLPNTSVNQQYFPSQQSQSTRPPQSVPFAGLELARGGSAPAEQSSAVPPMSSQNIGFRGQVAPNTSVNQQYFHSQQSQLMRPLQSMPSAGLELGRGGNMAGPATTSSNILNDWQGGRTIRPAAGAESPNRGISLSTSSAATTPQTLFEISSQPAAKDSKIPGSGNGFASDTFFGGDKYSAKPSPVVKQDFPAMTSSTSSGSISTLPLSLGPQPPLKSGSLDSLQSAFTMHPSGNQLPRAQSLVNQNQNVLAQSSPSVISSAISTVGANSTSTQSQGSWPRMTPSDIQKYTKVFMEVDTDKDGRITGEQARNLFLSWRLPREILKQVWDLSDQDNDSMLSVREFCIALYLMERYREGRPLPTVLPNNILFNDESLLPNMSQSRALHGNATWGATPGLRPERGMAGAQPMPPATGLRPPLPVSTFQADGALQSYRQNSRVPATDKTLVNQPSSGKQNLTFQADTYTEKKVEGTKNEILDSKEKIEFYRSKMQDLVMYKSRCDNRLNEITERASADKREAELLGKKYEEKYKQVAEINSKLAVEEARFRDIQERKMELHQAIVKMEQGGSADGILQVRADRIQSDLEELIKALSERCKKHGLDIKTTAVIELPIGWQPGIQEGAADWDEDWDKFEDEGFSFVKDFVPNGQDLMSSPKQETSPVWNDKASPNGSSTPKSFFDADGTSEKAFGTVEHSHASESAYAQSVDDYARSSLGSPAGKTTQGSPSHEFSDAHSVKSTELDAEMHRSFDEPSWGAFDNNDDVDSVWGFNPVNTKDSDLEKHKENYFFGSGDPSFSQGRTDSPSADTAFQKKSPFIFADSLPSTPLSRASNSPRYSEASGDHFFDNFSRFDSFSMHDSGFSPAPGTFARFDSVSSSRDFSHGRGFPSFDDPDPFGSSGPFKVSSESQTPKKGNENWSAF